jgi:hypothetical protein
LASGSGPVANVEDLLNMGEDDFEVDFFSLIFQAMISNTKPRVLKTL